MSFRTSRRAKSILASLLIASNFVNPKINAMESKPGQNQDTYQQQNKPWWQVRGEQAVANEENLLFEGLIVDPNYLGWVLNNTVNYCQNIYDEAQKSGIKLLVTPSREQREKLGIIFGKCCYNKLLTLSDNKQVLGCQIISAHLMRQLTSVFSVNARLAHVLVTDGKVSEVHGSVLVPCADGKLYVLNIFKDSNSDKFFSTIHELLTYADHFMAYSPWTKCAGSNGNGNVGLYIRVLLNQMINRYKESCPNIVKPLIKTVDEIDQRGDLLLQPYIVAYIANHNEFDCKPQDNFSDGTPYVEILFSLISDDDKIEDYSKYDMNVWNAANNLSVLEEKDHWENFLKLAEAFPQSKVLIACPNAFEPKPGVPVIKLDIKGREAIKNLKADGKVFQKVLSLKEFLDIESKYYPELRELLKSGKLNKTMVNQWNWFLKNSKELEKTQYPENLPVLAFIASEQIENVNSMIESGEMKTSWEDINKNMITNDEIQKIIPLEGTHYLHHTQSATISEKLKDFFFENIELDFSKYFKNKNGCALFFDNEKYYTNNSTLVNIEKSPCSTFKIVITLAGLKYRILQDENTVIKWDGKKRYFDEWNKDLNLKEAFNSSAVWYFQEVANKIGRKRLDEFIKSISYGNCDTSGEFPFWLDSSLKISPKQQVEFLRALFEHNLSVDETHISILKKIMSKGNLNGGNLYGKTGTSGESNNGWFVGFYEKENKKLYFAVNLSEGENVSGKQAERIAKNIIINCF